MLKEVEKFGKQEEFYGKSGKKINKIVTNYNIFDHYYSDDRWRH